MEFSFIELFSFQVHIYGSIEERNSAKGMIEVLLGLAPAHKYEEFITNISTINDDPAVMNLLKYPNSKKPGGFKEFGSANPLYQSQKWYSRFLNNLPRTKKGFLSKLAKTSSCLKSIDIDISHPMKLLKKHKKKLNTNQITPKGITRMQKQLAEVSRVIIGREMYGEGEQIHKRLSKLQKQVRACKNEYVSEEQCEDVARTLAQVHEPPLEKIDAILIYAEDYFERLRLPDSTSTLGSSLTNEWESPNKYKVVQNKCKHNRVQFKCKICKNDDGKKKDRRCKHNAMQSRCVKCKKIKENQKKSKKCKHNSFVGRCKKCKKQTQHPKNSNAFWNDIFGEY